MNTGIKAIFVANMLLAALPGIAAPREVFFNSLDGTVIKAWVFPPTEKLAKGTVKGTVIALHGCGGLYASGGRNKGLFNARHQAMADLLVAEGYAAVFPDSFTPRGESSICVQKIGMRKIDQSERRADTLATLDWVAAQPWGQATRTALLGWSHGGSAVLGATDVARAEVRRRPVQPAVGIAFYPGCSAALKSGYRMGAPLVMMLAEKDDWTPPAPCIELGKAVGAEVNIYPDSYHDFDSPTGRVQLRKDVPNGVNPGQGVHVGPNPAAREAAYARLREILRKALP
ncbi:MAG TPA: dienelactone hydrolase family protein [Polaromonas sp.]|uniref:dienelactone hydrolase family protein n=1 Tax=Polaromonas sp. TaxID=1869339 RepID=UPI002D233FD5|nr:dienelactone hydrolase family protein [Polaromonas sp.]HYW57380.1 dienelactone hydrolase family protein [Polaromonas sp.]